MYILSDELYFPSVNTATSDGILAIGGDLKPNRLLYAYRNGIFPWFEDGDPIIWWCPDPRMVLFLNDLYVSKSMRKILNSGIFKITFNQNFEEVIRNCKSVSRANQKGTWITNDMIEAYIELNKLGYAKSVEVWLNNELVGGLYGVDLGNIFCGESMFSKVSNASKVAFVFLVNYLRKHHYKLLDCQVYNDHLASLGCVEISRNDFMTLLNSV